LNNFCRLRRPPFVRVHEGRGLPAESAEKDRTASYGPFQEREKENDEKTFRGLGEAPQAFQVCSPESSFTVPVLSEINLEKIRTDCEAADFFAGGPAGRPLKIIFRLAG
jgi:hypothetical protein